MARAHFGRGDKAQWGYLGSRKAVYDEWKEGRSFGQLASIFDRPQGAIRDLVLEYEVYLEALKLTWTAAEKVKLLEPSVEFNPPVRFLQTSGHKQLVGLDLDRINMPIKFIAPDSKAKFQHLIRSMIIVQKGPSATASYAEVFADYVVPAASGEGCGQQVSPQGCGSARNAGTGAANTGTSGGNAAINQASVGGSTKLKLGALFDYPVLVNDLTLKQLMKEANDLNTKRFPAAGTSLLRNIIELVLKLIIENQGANSQNRFLSLETALDLSLSNVVNLGPNDKKILKEFKNTHINYVNLGTHATVVPNYHRLIGARDCIDQFIKRNI